MHAGQKALRTANPDSGHTGHRGVALVHIGRHRTQPTLVMRRFLVTCCTLAPVFAIGCGSDSRERNDLSAMEQAEIEIGAHTFRVWVARSPEETRRGLMWVEEQELAAIPAPAGDEQGVKHPGMLFVFSSDGHRSFWMKNTVTPLDIAYIRSDGRIVSTHTMAPLETRSYPSGQPARFALEVLAGTFDALGIRSGDSVDIPESVLKGTR